MLCVVVISLISVLFLFGKLFISSINFTLSRGYFLFCFVSSHSINTHELRGDFVGGGGAISFAFCVCQHTSQKLTLHKQTELLFLFCATCSFIFKCVFFYVLAQHSDCVCVCVCVIFCLTSTQTERSISLFSQFSTRSRQTCFFLTFVFLENKIDLLAIMGCHLCITWRFHLFFRFRYLQDDVPLVLSNFV